MYTYVNVCETPSHTNTITPPDSSSPTRRNPSPSTSISSSTGPPPSTEKKSGANTGALCGKTYILYTYICVCIYTSCICVHLCTPNPLHTTRSNTPHDPTLPRYIHPNPQHTTPPPTPYTPTHTTNKNSAFLDATLKLAASAELVARIPHQAVQRSPLRASFFLDDGDGEEG